MKYKVGDKVRVKSIYWYNSNKDSAGYVHCGNDSFILDMSEMCGKEVTIEKILSSGKYNIKEFGWNWTNEMFEDPVTISYEEEDLLL